MIQTDLLASQGYGLLPQPHASWPSPGVTLGNVGPVKGRELVGDLGKDSVEKRKVDVRLQLCHG